MKVLYIDTSNSGISGDMFLASLLGLVSYPDEILNELRDLKNYFPGVTTLEIELLKVKRSDILIHKLGLTIKERKNHRTPSTLRETLTKFLEEKRYSDSAKDYAKRVLNSLIQAEALVHGELADKIHLHELSSVDTLVDILGVTKALDNLGGFDPHFKISCSKLPLGKGKIKTAHGILPVPAPATLKILEQSDLVIYDGPIENELVTPTGAALLANLKPDILPYEMNLNNVIYSTGQKEFKDFLNVLRLFYGEEKEKRSTGRFNLHNYLEPITVLETDLDDVSGEIIGNFIRNVESISEKILDIQIIPSITKKNRPSHYIKVLCSPEYKFEIIEKMLDELGTLGVRINTMNRVCVDRIIEKKEIEIENKVYDLRYKISYIESEKQRKIINIKPEYEDLKSISNQSGFSIKKVEFYAQAQITKIFNDHK